MKAALFRDMLTVLGLALIFIGVWKSSDVGIACIVLGTVLLALQALEDVLRSRG